MDLICDIGYWIKQIDKDQDFSWLFLNTNNSISAFYHKAIKETLYGDSNIGFMDNDARFIISVLLIRQTIEQRMKGILGIDYITNAHQQVGLSLIIKIICKLKLLKNRHGIYLGRISKINDWANHFLHRGLRPPPWQLEWAEYEVSKLFYTGMTTDLRSHSIYASFETESIEELRKEFESLLSKEKSEIEIKWTNKIEIYEKK